MDKLLIFTFPIVLTNLIQQLYSMVDLIIIDQSVGNVGTVDVNTGGEMADLVTPVATGFSTTGQIFIAQLLGAEEDTKIKKMMGTLLSFMLILPAVLSMAAVFYHTGVLKLLNCPMEAMGQAGDYMMITVISYPFTSGYNAVCGVLRGMGEPRQPLFLILVAATVNIILDLLLVTVFHMEAAEATIVATISQMEAFLAALLLVWERQEKFNFELKLPHSRLDRDILKVLIRLGILQVVRSMFVRFGTLWANPSANVYGLVVSATGSVGNKLQKFLEVLVQGIDAVSVSMVGQSLGARKVDRAGKTTLHVVVATLGYVAVPAMLCLFFPHQTFGTFMKDEAVIALGAVFPRIFVLHLSASTITSSLQAMMTGCGFVELGFILGLPDGLICKIDSSLLSMYVFHMGYSGLWRGAACPKILPGCICVGYYLSDRWGTRRLLIGR